MNLPRFSSALAGTVLTAALAAQGPIAHYRLQSDLKDSAGTNHGTFEGTGGPNTSATFVFDSTFGSALAFDGVDDRINLGPIHTFQNSSWSVSFWVNTTDTTTTGLIGKNDGNVGFARGERVMEITGPNSWTGLGTNRASGNFAVNGHSMAGLAARRNECAHHVQLNDGHWHFIAAVHDEAVSPTHLTIYIDGEPASTTTGTFSNNVQPDVGNFYLGFSNYSGNNGVDYLAGKMAEVNFYSRPIGSLDLLLLYAPFQRRLAGDTGEISVQNGGRQSLRIRAGGCNANQNYWIFGSITGTSPGTTLGRFNIPLNIDPYTTLVMGLTNSPVFAGFRGALDATGAGTGTLTVPANQPIPIGARLHHACLVFDAGGQILDASNAVEVRFVQ